MASRVYERISLKLIKLSHRLEDLKPTGQELDRQRIGTEVSIIESAVDDLVGVREHTMKRMGKLDKDQDLCRQCGSRPASATSNDGMRQCTQCFGKQGVRMLERVIE